MARYTLWAKTWVAPAWRRNRTSAHNSWQKRESGPSPSMGGGSGMPTTGLGGLGGRKGAWRRGRWTFFRCDFQNWRWRREMSAARIALSNTSFTPNWATMLVSKYGIPSSLATSWPRSGGRMSVGLMGLRRESWKKSKALLKPDRLYTPPFKIWGL